MRMATKPKTTTSVRPRKTSSLPVTQISAVKPYEVLVDQIRNAILSGEIGEGEALPPERELVAQTGLTRGAVREALRTLSIEGMIETRSGRFGGTIVTLPDTKDLASMLNRFVRGRRLPLRTLLEVRDAIEPPMAGLAALNRTEEQLAAIKLAHEKLVAARGDFPRFAQINMNWHYAVAQASGNELLSGIFYALVYGLNYATLAEEYDNLATRDIAISIHAKITEAIENRDHDAARRRMQRHVSASNVLLPPAGQDIPLSQG